LVNRPEELPLQEQRLEKDVFMVNQCCGSAGASPFAFSIRVYSWFTIRLGRSLALPNRLALPGERSFADEFHAGFRPEGFSRSCTGVGRSSGSPGRPTANIAATA
jgi:hypothetical protein